MICIILAAGYATRMYPLTENFPKPLLPIKDKPIINYLIEDIHKEVDKFIIVTNNKFYDIFNKWKNDLNYNIEIIDDGSTNNENRLGAINDILFTLNKSNINDNIIILAGDNLLDFSLKEFINYFRKINKSCIMIHYEEDINKLQKTGVAEINNNKLIFMEEKPINPKSNLAIPPFYIYKKEDIPKIKNIKNYDMDSPGNLVKYLLDKTEIYTMIMPGKRYDIGSIENYEIMKNKYEKRN